MLAPVLSANEIPPADATAADGRGHRGDDGRRDAMLPDRLSLGSLGRRAGGLAGGDLPDAGHVGLRFLGGPPGATHSDLSTKGRVRIRPVARKCSNGVDTR
jgi:hypothetical protein